MTNRAHTVAQVTSVVIRPSRFKKKTPVLVVSPKGAGCPFVAVCRTRPERALECVNRAIG